MQDDYFLTIFQRYCNNQLTEKEYLTLQQWLAASPDNKQLMIDFLKLYKREKQWKALHSINVHDAWSQMYRNYRRNSIRRTLYRYAAAACLLLVLGCGFYLYSRMDREPSLIELFPNQGVAKATLTLSDGRIVDLNADSIIIDNGDIIGQNTNNCLVYAGIEKNGNSPQYNIITVPQGGEYMLVLSDGSKVRLNAESSLRYPVEFDKKERKVELTGEAYFEVTENEVPFLVQVQENQVMVLGTHFNVSAYVSESMITTLASGSVEVRSSSGKVLLEPNQQAEINSGTAKIAVRQVNVDFYTAWATGLYRFDNTPLEDITAQLSRWYNVKIEYASPEIKKINFTGIIVRNKSLGFALDLIQRISDVRFKKENDIVKVYEP
jgi:ferric-dicitrate binding protein FerR (iron transport regulator)